LVNSPVSDLVREKIDQAIALLDSMEIDCWLCFARETSMIPEPALELIDPYGVTWESAFLFCRDGRRIAIVGRYDVTAVESLGAYGEVIGYDEAIRPHLAEILRRINPSRLAIDFSKDDPAADGLTVGMRMILDEILGEAGIGPERLESAEALLATLRGLKSAGEVSLIRRTIATTESLLNEFTTEIAPGRSEYELASFLHRRMKELDLEPAWEWEMNPAVNTGPDSPPGHSLPGSELVQRGHLVHIDFGVRQNGYCSDLQRMWYVLEKGQVAPPDDVLQVWEHTRGALLAGAAALKPGVAGWEVDQAARGYLTSRGLPEYMHAFGHNLGRAAHDGGGLLGPRWERYGRTPYRQVQAGNVFAIELNAPAPGRGWISLEENVLVTDRGAEWLSTPQTELLIVAPD
jgi:Xaa-Pro aminopeptidase